MLNAYGHHQIEPALSKITRKVCCHFRETLPHGDLERGSDFSSLDRRQADVFNPLNSFIGDINPL